MSDLPKCVVCGLDKAPRGRSAPLGGRYCSTWDCDGYLLDPKPGQLWPGETWEEAGIIPNPEKGEDSA